MEKGRRITIEQIISSLKPEGVYVLTPLSHLHEWKENEMAIDGKTLRTLAELHRLLLLAKDEVANIRREYGEAREYGETDVPSDELELADLIGLTVSHERLLRAIKQDYKISCQVLGKMTCDGAFALSLHAVKDAKNLASYNSPA